MTKRFPDSDVGFPWFSNSVFSLGSCPIFQYTLSESSPQIPALSLSLSSPKGPCGVPHIGEELGRLGDAAEHLAGRVPAPRMDVVRWRSSRPCRWKRCRPGRKTPQMHPEVGKYGIHGVSGIGFDEEAQRESKRYNTIILHIIYLHLTCPSKICPSLLSNQSTPLWRKYAPLEKVRPFCFLVFL